MYNYYINILREQIKDTNVSSSNKCQMFRIMSLCIIHSLSARVILCKMAIKKVKKLCTNKEGYQFQVSHLSYLNLEQNK